MRSHLPTLALLGLLLMAAPFALAQEEAPPADEKPADQAWVDDCPPDMMCAAGANETPDERPQQFGPDGCIDCMGPVDEGSTCMDGEQEGESCRDDVQYLDGRGPADCEYCRGEDAGPIESHQDGVAVQDAAKPVPALAVGAVLLALGATVLLVRRA